MKYEIQAINETYNAIILERDGMYEYYLEKVGYANLLFLFGYAEKIEVIEEHISEELAEEFWCE
jgi:hypothetical protein